MNQLCDLEAKAEMVGLVIFIVLQTPIYLLSYSELGKGVLVKPQFPSRQPSHYFNFFLRIFNNIFIT